VPRRNHEVFAQAIAGIVMRGFAELNRGEGDNSAQFLHHHENPTGPRTRGDQLYRRTGGWDRRAGLRPIDQFCRMRPAILPTAGLGIVTNPRHRELASFCKMTLRTFGANSRFRIEGLNWLRFAKRPYASWARPPRNSRPYSPMPRGGRRMRFYETKPKLLARLPAVLSYDCPVCTENLIRID
jgi:hypothetical protein